MLTIKELIQDDETRSKYEAIKNMAGLAGMRSSIYDVNNDCNLRCKGCFYFSSDQHKVDDEKDLGALAAFIEREKARGVGRAPPGLLRP